MRGWLHGPLCVQLGWRSILLEPAPPTFVLLRDKYSNRARYPRVRTVGAAVCDTCGADPVAFWHIDLTNATGNWGSQHADARCIAFFNPAARKRLSSGTVQLDEINSFLGEVSSLSERHILNFARLYSHNVNACNACNACGERLAGRPFPADCGSRVIRDNTRSTPVRCYCMQRELPWAYVSLLMIGAHAPPRRTTGPCKARRNLPPN